MGAKHVQKYEVNLMKILSVSSSWSLDAASWRILNIARLLRSSGHEVHTIHYVSKSTYEWLEKQGYSSIKDDFVIVANKHNVHLKHLNLLKKGDYDLVYGNTHDGAFCALLGKLTNIPLIFDMHGGIVEEFLLNNSFNMSSSYSYGWLFSHALDFLDLSLSNRIICVSNKMIDYLNEHKSIPKEKMAYVTNGVDLDFFRPVDGERVNDMKRQLGLEGKFVIGYLGAFDKWQGVENFIRAAEAVRIKDLAFLIVGGNEKKITANTIVLPRVDRNQIPCYYSICDVLVLPRPSHPATEIAAPTKFGEYASMGKPILTTSVGDAGLLVKKYKCGIVVPDNSVQNLVKGISEFSNASKRDLTLMGISSRKLAETEFDWNKVGKCLEDAIRL